MAKIAKAPQHVDTWPDDSKRLVAPDITVGDLRAQSAEVFRTRDPELDFAFPGRVANKFSFIFALNGTKAREIETFNSQEVADQLGITLDEFNQKGTELLVGKLLRVGHALEINGFTVTLLGLFPYSNQLTAWKPIESQEFALAILEFARWAVTKS